MLVVVLLIFFRAYSALLMERLYQPCLLLMTISYGLGLATTVLIDEAFTRGTRGQLTCQGQGFS